MKPMNRIALLSTTLLLILAGAVSADQRPRHYEGKAAQSVDVAFENLAETNGRIAEMMADGEMEPEEMAELHKLTYTAENSLAKISEKLEALKEMLEVIHQSSEGLDGATVLEQTPGYLTSSQELFGR